MGADSGQLSVQIHGSDPWIDPWIKLMDQINGSEQKAGQNRLPYLVCA